MSVVETDPLHCFLSVCVCLIAEQNDRPTVFVANGAGMMAMIVN